MTTGRWKTQRTQDRSDLVGPGGADRGRRLVRRRSPCSITGTFTSYEPRHAGLGPGRARDGRRRQGEAARRGDRSSRLHRHERRRGPAPAEHRPWPVQIPTQQRRGGNQVHHRIRLEVRRPHRAPRSQPQTAGPRGGAALAQRHRRGQHGVREPAVGVARHRPGEAQRGAVGVRRRGARQGRAARAGHHRHE